LFFDSAFHLAINNNKNIQMKQYKLTKLIPFFAAVVSLTACLKGSDINIPSVSGSILQLQYIDVANYGTTINSGLQYFSSTALTFPASHVADTVNFTVNAVGADPVGSDVTITIGADSKAIQDNYKNDSITYVAMPDSTYKIINKTATIKAGQRVANFAIVFYTNKFDPTKSFNLPITVTDPQGYAVSSNYGYIYFHRIGNPLSGNYIETSGTRYNYTGSVAWAGYPAAIPSGYTATTNYTGATIVPSVLNDHTISIRMGNVPDPVSGSAYYIITASSDYKSISYTFASTFLNGYSNIQTYVASYTPPSATQKAVIHLITKYNNTTGNAGNDRLIDETFTQQ